MEEFVRETVRPVGPAPYLDRRLSFHAIFAGALVFFVVQGLCALLGMAVAATIAHMRDEVSRGTGIGLGIWMLGSLLVAAYAGGWVAACVAKSESRRDGLVQGFVTWAATWALGLLALGGGFGRGISTFGGWSQMAERLAADATARQATTLGLWILFIGILLSLLSALAGGAAGAHSEWRHARRLRRERALREPLREREIPVPPPPTTTTAPQPL